MDQCTFEGLVNEVTGWWSQDVPDWIRFMDSDRLRYLDNVSEKRKWLRKAKVENLRKAIQERVDAIVEAWEIEDDLLINVLMATFPEDLKAYKNKLTSAQRQMWINKATFAACGRNAEIATSEPVIYFVTFDRALVKIGHTTNLTSRLRSLRTADPREPIILLTIWGSREDEAKLHHQFSDVHVGREWFKLTREVEEFIESQRFSGKY